MATVKDTKKSLEIRDIKQRSDPSAADELRMRAAWLYYIEGLTQQETSKILGVNRVQVTRILGEARRRGEIYIRVRSAVSSIIELEREVEKSFGLQRVMIAPTEQKLSDPTKSIASKAGQFISDFMKSGITVGVGWGRTLHSTLPYIQGRDLEDVKVISLLGGISQAKRFNPAEFAWQFAELFDGEGYLVPAPALVDSPQTKHTLLEHCGINQIFEMADRLDAAFVSVGGIDNVNTSYRVGHISEAERRSLAEAGAAGDLLYNFISADGSLVDHDVNERAVSIEIDRLKRAKERVLISGGQEKVNVLLGCIKLLEPTVLITDENTAKTMLSIQEHRENKA